MGSRPCFVWRGYCVAIIAMSLLFLEPRDAKPANSTTTTILGTDAVMDFATSTTRASEADSGTTTIATIRTCIPATLGSEYARRSQIWEFREGRLLQPYFWGDDRCLTPSSSPSVQGAPSLVMEICGGGVLLAHNQSWQLNEDSQIILAGGTHTCLDVAGYRNVSGSPLHLWPCTRVPAVFPALDGNERWEWHDDGTVRSVMSGLCLDVGGGGGSAAKKTCELADFNRTAYCNASLSAAARASALVQEANLTARIANLGVGVQTGVPGLGVPPLSFSEALHGAACGCVQPLPSRQQSAHGIAFQSTGCPTSFPNALGLAASYNRSLWAAVGTAIGVEGRALHNVGTCGLAFFSPNINLYRDPRWGRGMETPGEDPLTAGEYAAAYVSGMADRWAPSPRTGEHGAGRQRVVVGPKHFLDYDMEGRHDATSPDWGPSRNDFDAVVARQEQVEFYLPAWHAAVSIGRAGAVMCSTNRVNGVDACMNPTYINGFLRQRFGFDGYVVTDGNSCGNPNCEATVAAYNASAGWGEEGHRIATKLCLRGGTDIELGQTLLQYAAGALEEGQIASADVSRANTRVFEQFIKAGWLDRTADDGLGAPDVDTPAHRDLARDAATDGMVLLKNIDGLLPLERPGIKVALVGPHVNTTTAFLSNYHGPNSVVQSHSIEVVLRADPRVRVVGSAPACDISTGCQSADIASVQAAVQDADVVLAFVGLYPTSGAPSAHGYGKACSESESWDRGDILLCGRQEDILRAAAAADARASGGSGIANLVVVLINGGTIASRWIHDKASSVLEAWYPGQAGGAAIAAVLLGDRAPSGRLPITIYDESFVPSRGQAGNITQMSLRDNGGITYMHHTGDVLWPFGFGLSYTRWHITASLSSTTASTVALADAYASYYSPGGAPPAAHARTNDGHGLPEMHIHVANLGARDSAVVVQVFAAALAPHWRGNSSQAPLPPPQRQLVGFTRLFVPAGGNANASVALVALPLCVVDGSGSQWAAPGTWLLLTTVDGQYFVKTQLNVTGRALPVLEWPTV